MAAHARFSASASSRWLECTASIGDTEYLRQQGIISDERTSNKYADEGTACHSLAELTWDNLVDPTDPYVLVSLWEKCPSTGIAFTQQHAEIVKKYLDALHQYAQGAAKVFIEKRSDYSERLGLDAEEGFGTADAVILTKDGELQIHDLKTGHRRVYAEDNSQLMLYALGVYDALGGVECKPKIKTVRLVIHQPPLDVLDEHVMTLNELDKFREYARARAMEAKAYADGNAPVATYSPSTDRCKYCPVGNAGQCKAQTEAVASSMAIQFEDLTQEAAPPKRADVPALRKVPITELAQLYRWREFAEDYFATLHDILYEAALNGEDDGLHMLVEGRKGNRAYSDAKAVEEMLKAAGVPEDKMYSKSLVTPAQAEKVLKGDKELWSKVEATLTQAEGKPKLVLRGAGKGKQFAPVQFENLTE